MGEERGRDWVRSRTNPLFSRGSFGDVIFGDDAMEKENGEMRYGASSRQAGLVKS